MSGAPLEPLLKDPNQGAALRGAQAHVLSEASIEVFSAGWEASDAFLDAPISRVSIARTSEPLGGGAVDQQAGGAFVPAHALSSPRVTTKPYRASLSADSGIHPIMRGERTHTMTGRL